MTKADLSTAYFDNVRNNQIGVSDGVDPDVMADIGYETPDRAAEILHNYDPTDALGKVAMRKTMNQVDSLRGLAPFSIRDLPPVPEDPDARGKARRSSR